MSHASERAQHRVAATVDRTLDLAMRVVPVGVLIAIGAWFAAQQAVSPHHRSIKVAVLAGLMVLMLRFDMVYSVYLFALLFVFPSGISVGSTNNLLMTIIPMIWAVRATSSKTPLIQRTRLDLPIALFLLANVVSLIAVDTNYALLESLKVLWRTGTAVACFYMIVNFVDDEKKLQRMVMAVCISCTVVMLTAILELFAPGASIVPGWIGLTKKLGEGEFHHRVEGMRIGGAFESHGMLSDFGTQMIVFMVLFAIRSRNPFIRLCWLAAAGVTLVAILSTANRGATVGLALAFLLSLAFFRDRIGSVRVALILIASITLFLSTETFLRKYTLAVSVVDRFASTKFEGVVPDTRTMTWKPAIMGALESPFVGNGPYYDTGVGLTARFWPHNGYIFYFYTLGLFGLGAFLFVMGRVFQYSRKWRHPAIRYTATGQLLAVAQIWFIVMAVEQLRTDHQRDDIYPYIVWMCFAVVVAAARIAARIETENPVVTDGMTRGGR